MGRPAGLQARGQRQHEGGKRGRCKVTRDSQFLPKHRLMGPCPRQESPERPRLRKVTGTTVCTHACSRDSSDSHRTWSWP